MEVKFIDVHAHLCDSLFLNNIKEIASRLSRDYIVLNTGENSLQNTEILECSTVYPFIMPCIGLHPNEIAKMSYDMAMKELEYLSDNVSKAYAISEVGLDYKGKDIYQIEQEKEFLYKIFEIAQKNKKVCIIHSRKSIEDVFEMLSSFDIKVITHNFEGNLRQLRHAQDIGLNISISTGFMRFKKDNIIRNVELEKLFTETDSPVLSPDDKTNTPLNIPKLLNYIASLRDMNIEELKSVVYSNLRRVFND